jgi:hypothetical protein
VSTGTSRQSSNAFSESFLQLDIHRDEPSETDDPSSEGPWIVLPGSRQGWPHPEHWNEIHGIWPLGERPERSDAAAFLSSGRSLSLYASIARPIAGRDPLYVLGQERWRGGFPLSRQGRVEAWMEIFHPEWALLTGALASMGQRPYDVAVFLEAIGPSARRRAGTVLHERLVGSRE